MRELELFVTGHRGFENPLFHELRRILPGDSGGLKRVYGGIEVTLVQKTDYPWDGRVKFAVQASGVGVWTLALRVPGWCRKATVKVNGTSMMLTPKKGFVHIKREWMAGDRVELALSMPVEQVAVNPLARQVTGRD